MSFLYCSAYRLFTSNWSSSSTLDAGRSITSSGMAGESNIAPWMIPDATNIRKELGPALTMHMSSVKLPPHSNYNYFT